MYELLFTLRRTQGAIGRYEGATGAAVAAVGRLRRHGRCRRRIPGVGKGLKTGATCIFPPFVHRFPATQADSSDSSDMAKVFDTIFLANTRQDNRK